MSAERKKASDFPKEVLTLFDKFVHGMIDRRAFREGAAEVAAGGVTAAVMLDSSNRSMHGRSRCRKTTVGFSTSTSSIPLRTAQGPCAATCRGPRTVPLLGRRYW